MKYRRNVNIKYHLWEYYDESYISGVAFNIGGRTVRYPEILYHHISTEERKKRSINLRKKYKQNDKEATL